MDQENFVFGHFSRSGFVEWKCLTLILSEEISDDMYSSS